MIEKMSQVIPARTLKSSTDRMLPTTWTNNKYRIVLVLSVMCMLHRWKKGTSIHRPHRHVIIRHHVHSSAQRHGKVYISTDLFCHVVTKYNSCEKSSMPLAPLRILSFRKRFRERYSWGNRSATSLLLTVHFESRSASARRSKSRWDAVASPRKTLLRWSRSSLRYLSSQIMNFRPLTGLITPRINSLKRES